MPAPLLTEFERGVLRVAAANDDGIVAPDDVALLDLAGGDIFLSRDTCKALKKRKLLEMLGSTGNYKINNAGRAALEPAGSY